MPFLYKTEYKFSDKHGLGIYASEDIPAGAIYWTLMPHPQQVPVEGLQMQQNKIYTQSSFNSLEESQKKHIINHAYFFSKGKVLIGLFDGSYYFNHDIDGPSLTIFDGDLEKLHSIMIRNVKKGEQILQNYAHWTVDQCQWLGKVMKQYLPMRYEFEIQVVFPLLDHGERKTKKTEKSEQKDINIIQQQRKEIKHNQ